MKGSFHSIPYRETGCFTPIVLDYLSGAERLRPFYQWPATAEGFAAALEQRSASVSHRQVLADHLVQQYEGLETAPEVRAHINALRDPNTFTVCTAHQPALFTGPLYFIYKILHTLRLADELHKQHPGKHFVPVFWMGSEDADLEELGKFYLGREKIVWNTTQSGAVGRMNNKGISELVNRIAGELSVLPFGGELVQLLQHCYLGNHNIQEETFRFLNALFGRFGLVVLIPDSASLKKLMIPYFEDDLFGQVAFDKVQQHISALEKGYNIQAHPRPINLFYLKDQVRNRIERTGEGFRVVDTNIQFTEAAIREELQHHPERFSPNVILRGLFQELVLPNIVFVGGGGELAYWLELKALFDHYRIAYPVLILRNSFLLADRSRAAKIHKLGFAVSDFFQPESQLLERYARKHAAHDLDLSSEIKAAEQLYQQLQGKASLADASLNQHVEALKVRMLKTLEALQQKIWRAEKRKYETERGQIANLKQALFPNGGLQERTENFMPYYARYGKTFLDVLYRYSFSTEQQFGILEVE